MCLPVQMIIITKVVQKEENVSAGKSFKLEVYYKMCWVYL